MVSCIGLHMVEAFATCVGVGGIVTIWVCVSTFVTVTVVGAGGGAATVGSGSEAGKESASGGGVKVDVCADVVTEAFLLLEPTVGEADDKDISVRALILGRILLSATLPEGGIFVSGSRATRSSGQFF